MRLGSVLLIAATLVTTLTEPLLQRAPAILAGTSALNPPPWVFTLPPQTLGSPSHFIDGSTFVSYTDKDLGAHVYRWAVQPGGLRGKDPNGYYEVDVYASTDQALKGNRKVEKNSACGDGGCTHAPVVHPAESVLPDEWLRSDNSTTQCWDIAGLAWRNIGIWDLVGDDDVSPSSCVDWAEGALWVLLKRIQDYASHVLQTPPQEVNLRVSDLTSSLVLKLNKTTTVGPITSNEVRFEDPQSIYGLAAVDSLVVLFPSPAQAKAAYVERTGQLSKGPFQGQIFRPMYAATQFRLGAGRADYTASSMDNGNKIIIDFIVFYRGPYLVIMDTASIDLDIPLVFVTFALAVDGRIQHSG